MLPLKGATRKNYLASKAKRLALAAMICVVAVESHSAERLADYEEFRLERLSDEEEIPHAAISSIFQSKDGHLWIGTYEGIHRYDGYSFHSPQINTTTNVGYTGQVIKKFAFGHRQDSLVFAADSKLFEFDTTNNSLTVLVDLGEMPINDFLRVGDFFLLATNYGLLRFDHQTDEPPLKVKGLDNDTIHSLAHNSAGEVFVGTDSALLTLNGVEITKKLDTRATHIAMADKYLWVANSAVGLKKIDFEGNTLASYGFSSKELPGTRIRSLMLSSLGDLWVGTDKGVKVFTSTGNKFLLEYSAHNEESLSNNTVTSMFEDKGKNIWIGTFDGLNKYSPNLKFFPKFSQGSRFEGLRDNTIISLFESQDNTVWFGTGDGLVSWKPGETSLTSYPSKLLNMADPKVMSISAHNRRLFLGTRFSGMNIYDKTSLRLIKTVSTDSKTEPRLKANAVSSIQTHQNRMYIGTFGNGFEVFSINKDGAIIGKEFSDLEGAAVIGTTVDSDGYIWVGTSSSGAYRYANFSSPPEVFSEGRTSKNSITSNNLISIRATGQNVWLSTRNGLNLYNTQSKETVSYTTNEGLPSNFVYSVEVDDQGIAWISTTRGLSRLNPETGEIRNFNTSHGLQGDDFNGNASIKLSDGTLLFGGNNGFNAFDPSKIAFNDYQGQTLITAFSKMNQPQTGRFLSDGSETIELSYKENVFSFEFALMDFTAPEDNTFEYQLVGFDEDWINSGKRNNVSYTNLDAGDYEFRVRGYNNDGVATDKIASIHLSVAPPPWRTWYAYLAYALIALALFMTAFRLYTSRVIRITNEKRNAEERQRLEALVAERTAELNKKVEEQAITLQQKEVANKEIHHRVKNNLQVILGLLTLQAETEENEHFQTAMNEIRQRITSMSLIHKSLYEQTVATIDIKQYAENLINSIRQFHPEVANGNIEVALEVDNETLDIDTALPVGLVLNELITNCLKHGFANLQPGNDLNLIKVTFQREGDNYVMTVSDNGAGLPHGFDIDSPSSMGSELILIFAQQLDGQISAANLATGGAIFTLSFPVPETKLL